MTRGSVWISLAGPSAIFSPKSSTATRSHTPMTRPMSCSMRTTVRPESRIWRMSSISARFSDGFMPAAGSSSSSTLGPVAMARAISRRRWSP